MYSSTYVQHADVIQRVTRQRLHINMNPIIIVNVHDLINVHLHQFQDLLHRVEHVPTNVMSDHIFEYRYGDVAHGVLTILSPALVTSRTLASACEQNCPRPILAPSVAAM